ncbi:MULTISPECIES: restriction endonuclease subunit S [Staphylococcus]|uniref:restriction endonuclease subunit S n=1 Tax=Staphylococcus TaxID=1279 RepID=UPI002885ED36|nr:restriction endonuclease subunit S [Staphylococcus chromogenes]MDT0655641.1 restriction endonuclease subunit S [Staphylococcus chromogenes]
MEFKKVKLGEISIITMGQSPKSEFYSEIDGTPFLQGNRTFQHIYPVIDTYTKKVTKLANANDILFSVRAPVGDINIAPVDLCIGRGLCAIRSINNNQEFLFYLLKSKINELESQATGTIFSSVNKKTLENFIVNIPNEKQQKNIGTILSNLDKKIELNQKIIANLEELSQILFKRWFVDFEFPDENGNPYKSSGGQMVDSELGEIPKYWSIQTLNNISESYNTKRKPLSKLEREKVASIYPYYGATKIIDYVDDYLFNGKFILVGEDGTVQTEEGHPFVQYVWGKFWVSNHAHILKGNKLSDEILMLILNNIDIEPYITGAVQPKISKKNLNSIKVITGTKLIYEKFDQYIGVYYKKIREIRDENNNLIQLRDTLLPKLMSGEIEIPDDIEVNEDELSI